MTGISVVLGKAREAILVGIPLVGRETVTRALGVIGPIPGTLKGKVANQIVQQVKPFRRANSLFLFTPFNGSETLF